MLDSRVTMTTSSRIFVNLLSELEVGPAEAYTQFQATMGQLTSVLATPRKKRLSSSALKVAAAAPSPGEAASRNVAMAAAAFSGVAAGARHL